ncbi:hypothetical protein A1O3_08020 [Capronia epimyces CBS 606.96]|uniref:Uncharacterized protein n=1 Tax=Capronia epimyces CBS 606.96 TaxID=1182542 RepID=W9XGU3_9EURO|nr:uncharacterized protein A1O3_08020 [Capronia epimyces CBS 606.96]EXJ79737.1 hypothetical protein A1O3_08020 [Capronia epimyces CBS 606.96]
MHHVHLRIGRHEESYERTRFKEEELDVPQKNAVVSQVDNPVRIQHADVLALSGGEQVVEPSHSQDLTELPHTIRDPPSTIDEIAATDRVEAPRVSGVSLSVLPSLIWITRADQRTRVPYAPEVVHINNEPLIKTDDHHFVCATYADWLLRGDNITVRQRPYQHWSSARTAGRPQILFELYPIGQYEYTPANGRRKKSPHEFHPLLDPYGRVYLTAENRALRYSPAMPFQISTEIEGWEMEAVCRLDPDICHQDFVDRMIPNPVGGKGRPTKGTLNHRRRRDRMKMRVLPWPVPRQLSYSDSQVVDQLDEWGLANNSTARLKDLTKEEIDVQCAIMYGGHLERSGANAQNDQARLRNFRSNLALVRTAHAEDSEEVRTVKRRIAEQLEKMGLRYDSHIWDVSPQQEEGCQPVARE